MRRWRLVDFNDGTGGYGCRLVNFSNGGARLSGFVHASAIPEFVALFIRDRQILKRDCSVVWRGVPRCGRSVHETSDSYEARTDRVAAEAGAMPLG